MLGSRIVFESNATLILGNSVWSMLYYSIWFKGVRNILEDVSILTSPFGLRNDYEVDLESRARPGLYLALVCYNDPARFLCLQIMVCRFSVYCDSVSSSRSLMNSPSRKTTCS
ncbi:hypothetical protein ABKN59_010878 [Abortiporus biennis]